MRPQATESTKLGVAKLREVLTSEYPEVEWQFSDRYLSDVLSVKGRAFEYARDEKLRKSLEWRREFGCDRVCSRFKYDMAGGIFELMPSVADSPDIFIPSPELLELSKSGALRILPNRSKAGHIVLHAETQSIDWNAVGVEAGTQYHVLLIEAALNIIRSEHGQSPEALILLVDTTGPLLARPPPISALQSLVSLLQRAYPDRIQQICVGPVNLMVRGLYSIVSRFMSPKSRSKIKLVSHRPMEVYPLGPSAVDSSVVIAGAVADCVAVEQASQSGKPTGEAMVESHGKSVLESSAQDDECSTKASELSFGRDDLSMSSCQDAPSIGNVSAAETIRESVRAEEEQSSFSKGVATSHCPWLQCCCRASHDAEHEMVL